MLVTVRKKRPHSLRRKTSGDWNKLEQNLVKVIHDTIHHEMMILRKELIPYISDSEQQEINALYRKPNSDVGKILSVKI
ncbi:MAG: hypothetical protein A3H98_08960 [Bacteroidetes bacterium RIFCSPLOWO2_02_FULL_36_8]|nr:MAG: hypothetical protein A3H98_08960 [Bacteroidetes bacterium RIFCSPLOWO2_02_FULL_36_8]OFY70486.1 MAG: hypothetical protein A3G23_10210 [Bacteroidetes bacterium RIFCSPLOWO2_12_FULL_37_12]